MGTDDILAGFERGDTTALARAISLVENQRDGFEQVLTRLHPRVGRGNSHRIGITGTPGAGKSILTEGLIREYRGHGLKVRSWRWIPRVPLRVARCSAIGFAWSR